MTVDDPLAGSDLAEFIAVNERRLRRAEAARLEAERLLEHHSKALARSNRELAQRESDLIARLEQNNRQLLRAQEAANIATFHIDRGAPPVFSPQFFAIIGLSPDQSLSGEDVLGHVHPLDRRRIAAAATAFVAGAGLHEAHKYEHRLCRPDGAVRWLRWNMRRDFDASDRFIAVFGTVQDITEARAIGRHARALSLVDERRLRQLARLTEALKAANAEAARAHAAHNRFLAMTSHDIRTPLGGLLGLIDMLPAGALPPAERERLAMMRAAGEQLRLLVDDIIAIADMAAGPLQLDPAPVALAPLIADIAASWRQRRPGWQVSASVAEGLPALMLDARRFRQLCDGLLMTANGPEAGPIAIAVTLREGDFRLAISAAWRVGDGADYADYGAVIAQRIVAAMDGRVAPAGAGPDGWYCDIPIRPAPASWRPAAPAPPPQLRRTDGSRPRLLIAEDVETNRIVLGALVARLGCDHDAVGDGAAALAAVQSQGYDAVLMDVMMPVMDGAAATVAIRGLAPPLAGIPIIGITAHSLADERARLLAGGMTACLTKPVDAAELAALLAGLLAEAAPAPEIDLDRFVAAFAPLPAPRRATLLDLALADCRDLAAEIAAAHGRGDSVGQRRAAHSLSGVAGNFGANALVAALATMAGTGDPAMVVAKAEAFAATAPAALRRLLPVEA